MDADLVESPTTPLDTSLAELEAIKLGDPQAAIQLATQILAMAVEAQSWGAVCKCYREIASSHMRLGNYLAAVLPSQNALMTAQIHHLCVDEGHAFHVLGALHGFIGNNIEALEYFLKERQVGIEQDNAELIEQALSDLAFLHTLIGDFPKAIDYFQEFLHNDDRQLSVETEALALQNLGVTYHRMKDSRQALGYYEQSLALANEHNLAHIKFYALVSMTNSLCELNEMERAETIYSQLEDFCRQNGNAHQAALMQVRAHLVYAHRQLPEAIRLYQEALAVAHKFSDQQIMMLILEELIGACRELGDYEAALRHFEAFHHVKTNQVREQSRVRHDILNALHEVRQLQQEAEMQRLRSEHAEHELAEMQRTEAERLEKERLKLILEQERSFIQAKTRVLERIHHEFRTPLSVIFTTTEMLHRYSDRMTAEKQQELLERIDEQYQHMTRLLDGVKTLLEGIPDQYVESVTHHDMRSVCDRAVEAASKQIDASTRVVVTVDQLPDRVRVNAPVFEEIAIQLLTNALKFSKDQVKLDVWANDSRLILRVTDTGIGIPKDELQKVFEPLFRASNNDEVPGLGLGLKLVQESVEFLGGAIVLESELGQGTQVTVELPLMALAF